MPDPLTPYGNTPMITPIVNAANYYYASYDVLRTENRWIKGMRTENRK